VEGAREAAGGGEERCGEREALRRRATIPARPHRQPAHVKPQIAALEVAEQG
jgi:hypothetical protein